MSTASGPGPARDNIDLARGFRFVTEDPDWIKKVLIGGVFMLLVGLLVGAVFVAGYGLRLLRRTARGEPRPLPEWDDLGGLFSDGLRPVGIYFAYALPVAIIPMAFFAIAAVVGAGLSRAGSHEGSEAFGALMAIGFMGVYALMAVVMLALALYVPAALARFAMLERMGAAFEVRENLDFIRRNLSNYAMTLLLYLLASFAAQLGIVLCCVGFFPASFWAFCILCWGLGEVVRRDPTLAPRSGVRA
jgi:hypothetical protein